MLKNLVLAIGVVVVAAFGAANNAYAGRWKDVSISSEEKPLCQALYQRLEKYTWVSENQFWTIVATDPNLTEPPWQDLVPSEHKELLQRLMIYGQVWRDRYFDKIHPLQYVSDGEFYEDILRQKVVEGARLQLWRSRIYEVYEQGLKKAPPGEQTIIQWRTALDWDKADPNDAELRDVPRINWQGSNYFVTPDLLGPDPMVETGTGYVLSTAGILLYGGRPFLFDNNGQVFVFNQVVGLQTYCRFIFQKGVK